MAIEKYYEQWCKLDVKCILSVKEALEAVSIDGCALRFVIESGRTKEICLAAVKQNGCALQYVPDSLRTEEICLVAVRQDGYALQCVTDSKQTEEMCLLAVRKNINALKYVAERMFIGNKVKVIANGKTVLISNESAVSLGLI